MALRFQQRTNVATVPSRRSGRDDMQQPGRCRVHGAAHGYEVIVKTAPQT
jgi:hypothetical protein